MDNRNWFNTVMVLLVLTLLGVILLLFGVDFSAD
jgi:hypothetical protein